MLQKANISAELLIVSTSNNNQGKCKTPDSKAKGRLKSAIHKELHLPFSILPGPASDKNALLKEAWKVIEKPYIEGDTWKFRDLYTDAGPLTLDINKSKPFKLLWYSLDTGFL
jgi:hypothetical protein